MYVLIIFLTAEMKCLHKTIEGRQGSFYKPRVCIPSIVVGKPCLDQKAVSHTASATQRLQKSPTKMTYFLQQDSPPMRATTFPKNATRWGPNVQIHKVMGKGQMINKHTLQICII